MAVLTGCATAPTHPSLRAQSSAWGEVAPLVPVRNYVADWDGNGDYQISPDGRHLLWSARVGLGPGLFVKDLQTQAVRSLKVKGWGAVWAQDSRHILFHRDRGGDENFHVFTADAVGVDLAVKDLTPFHGAQSFLHSPIEGSDDLLISSNRRNPKVFDLYRYTAATEHMTVVATNPGDVAQWLTDPHGIVLGRVRKQGERWVYETPPVPQQDAWKAVFDVSFFDTVQTLSVSADGRFVWALSNRGRDKTALVQLDLASGTEREVFADARVDISHVLMSRATQTPILLNLDPDYPEIKVLNSRFQSAIKKLQGTGHRRVKVTSLSRDEELLIAHVSGPTGGQHLLYNMRTDQVTVLGESSLSRINAISPAPVQRPLVFPSQDGFPLHAYLTLPPGVPAQKLPTVVLVHGGPWARDAWLSSDSMESFLANRGYAVLQVNYRGSSGYGRAFQEAAQGEFAAKMHTDLLDGVDYLVQEGISDPSKVAIMGVSYGGYASLVGMTLTPDRFACGISMVGMSDLASLLENAPPYWEFGKPMWTKYVGDTTNPEDRAVMHTKSPLYFADQVQGPILILHGINDPRVKFDQSERMVEALKKAGKPVDFHVFKNAGHGVQSWPDRMTYFRKTEDFLAQCLGGRSSGFDLFQLGSWAF